MIKPWWIWGFWVSPLSYGQRAISVNEFTATRWMEVRSLRLGTHFCQFSAASYNVTYSWLKSKDIDWRFQVVDDFWSCLLVLETVSLQRSAFGNNTVGHNILILHSIPNDDYWYWIGVGVLLAYALLFSNIVTLALTYLNRKFKKKKIYLFFILFIFKICLCSCPFLLLTTAIPSK